MKDFFVGDAAQRENETVTSFFVVTAKQLRSKREGGAYLALTLADKTGQLDARMWEKFEELVGGFEAGDIVKAQAVVCRFAEKLQLKIEKIRRARPEEFDLADFVPHTEQDVDALWATLNEYVASFKDKHLFELVRSFLDDAEFAAKLREAPAAKSMHHAWIGGLLEHIVSLLGLCDATAGHYSHIHRDLLMTGAIFHDIGKLVELRWGTSFDYTLEGQLLGHITIGSGLIDRRISEIPGFSPELRVLVQHMIISHHGRYEFGSPKLPMIPEAVLLHYLDDMDAKMHTMTSEFRRAAAAGRDAAGMTEWVRAMERPLLNTQAYLASALAKDEVTETTLFEERPDAVSAED